MKRKQPKPQRKTLIAKGRQILETKRLDLRGELVDANGTPPKAGRWLVHPERKRCYGRVVRVRRNGVVVMAIDNRTSRSDGRRVYDGGYAWVDEKPPTGGEWLFFVYLDWTNEPPSSWANSNDEGDDDEVVQKIRKRTPVPKRSA